MLYSWVSIKKTNILDKKYLWEANASMKILIVSKCNKCDGLCDLVHPWKSVTFRKVVGFSLQALHSTMSVFQVFKIVQKVPNRVKHHKCKKNNLELCNLEFFNPAGIYLFKINNKH